MLEQTDNWNRIKNPETSANVCGNLVYNKENIPNYKKLQEKNNKSKEQEQKFEQKAKQPINI